MDEKKSYQSWTLSDEFWNEVKDYIPKKKRDPKRTYKNKVGQGRKPLDSRKVLSGIFYVLLRKVKLEKISSFNIV